MTNYTRIASGAIPKRLLRLILITAFAFVMPRSGAGQATTYETLYRFQGHPDAAEPEGALVIGSNGVLYGTTLGGGANGLGAVFELTKPIGQPWKETVLHSFSGSDGQNPESTLLFGSSGALYGTTFRGGGGGSGTIFQMAPPSTSGDAWTETVLYAFIYSRFSQNVTPNGTLLPGPGGTLYTTTQGSADAPGGINTGLVIALAPPATSGGAWTEKELYAFGGAGGESPLAGVVAEGGSLFGTTQIGGDFGCGGFGCGAVYELTPPPTPGGAWTETTIHIFTGSPGDGAGSAAVLTLGPGGKLYGTTTWGGSGTCNVGNAPGCGTVFQLVPPSTPGGTWTESVIYSFIASNGDGAFPYASVVVGKNGSLYGTTQGGGSLNLGTVFELTPSAISGDPWTETILHSFTGQSGDGATPVAGLALNSAGVLYGTTSAGGTAGKGTVFAVTP